jgi:NADP-dependent 3-hydroxy acid dehydrogenase YdfG
MSLKHKHVLITGAGRGLGAAFAVCCADAGAHVTMTGRNQETLAALAESIRLRTGTRPQTLALDLADISQVTLTAKQWRDDKRPLDILINNASQWLAGSIDGNDAYAIANAISANVTGTLLLTRGVLPLLEASGAGDIVNIISVNALTNAPLQGAAVAFSATKHAQAGISDGLREELRGRPIRITALYPPMLHDLSPLDGPAWSETPGSDSWITNRDVVETVFFALSRPRHMTMSAVTLESNTATIHGHSGSG